MRADYRWELWLPESHEDDASDALRRFCDGEFLRGPSLDATRDHPARVILYVDARASRKGVKDLDGFLSGLARRFDGHLWRVASKTLHMSQGARPD